MFAAAAASFSALQPTTDSSKGRLLSPSAPAWAPVASVAAAAVAGSAIEVAKAVAVELAERPKVAVTWVEPGADD